jgi:prepilin-type N-terminal cleavage/methylation domain-containing protein
MVVTGGFMNKQNHRSGFTLIELLVVISISAIILYQTNWVFVRFSQRLHFILNQRSFNETMFFRFSLLDRLMAEGGGLIYFSPERIEFYDHTGSKRSIAHNETRIMLDDSLLLFPDTALSAIKFEVSGPTFIPRDPDLPSTLLALDRNESGTITFSDLDTDYSGSLRGEELNYAGLVHISFKWGAYQSTFARSYFIRNRSTETTNQWDLFR